MFNREAGPGVVHVGLFSPALPSTGLSNGIVTYVRLMRDALRSIGHKVTVTDGQQIEFADGSIADVPMPTGLVCRMQTFAETWKGGERSHAYLRLQMLRTVHLLRTAGVHIVEIEETWGWAARLVGCGLPVVMRLHGPHAFAREGAERNRTDVRREKAELHAFQTVQAVSSPSASVLEAMMRTGEPQLARVIHNPVPLSSVKWSVEQTDPNQILFVGRFDLLKGADVVIQAFARAVAKRPELRLVMVGPDRGLGGTIRFEEFVQGIDPDARAKIEFLGELVPERITPLRLRSAFTIVGSRYETFPYTAFEAQALGMPLLMTDTLGPRGIITDGVDGRLVPIADAEAMANAILQMAGDPAATARMGAAGRAMVASKMNPPDIARQTVELYRDARREFLQREIHGRR